MHPPAPHVSSPYIVSCYWEAHPGAGVGWRRKNPVPRDAPSVKEPVVSIHRRNGTPGLPHPTCLHSQILPAPWISAPHLPVRGTNEGHPALDGAGVFGRDTKIGCRTESSRERGSLGQSIPGTSLLASLCHAAPRCPRDSPSLTSPSRVSRTLPAFTSLWMILQPCRYCSASSSCLQATRICSSVNPFSSSAVSANEPRR